MLSRGSSRSGAHMAPPSRAEQRKQQPRSLSLHARSQQHALGCCALPLAVARVARWSRHARVRCANARWGGGWPAGCKAKHVRTLQQAREKQLCGASVSRRGQCCRTDGRAGGLACLLPLRRHVRMRQRRACQGSLAARAGGGRVAANLPVVFFRVRLTGVQMGHGFCIQRCTATTNEAY